MRVPPVFPSPADRYDRANEAAFREAVARAIYAILADGDMVLRSPNGAYWRVNVADDGTLSTTAL